MVAPCRVGAESMVDSYFSRLPYDRWRLGGGMKDRPGHAVWDYEGLLFRRASTALGSLRRSQRGLGNGIKHTPIRRTKSGT